MPEATVLLAPSHYFIAFDSYHMSLILHIFQSQKLLELLKRKVTSLHFSPLKQESILHVNSSAISSRHFLEFKLLDVLTHQGDMFSVTDINSLANTNTHRTQSEDSTHRAATELHGVCSASWKKLWPFKILSLFIYLLPSPVTCRILVPDWRIKYTLHYEAQV